MSPRPRASGRRVVALVSGGVDSAALVEHYLESGLEVHPLYVRCGFVWESAELHWLRRLLRERAGPRLRSLVVMDARDQCRWGRHWSVSGRGAPSKDASWDSVHLPGRNYLLWGCAASLCARVGAGRAAIGSLCGNPFADAAPAFRRAAASLLAQSFGIKLVLEAPLWRRSKSDLSRLWPRLKRAHSFSCLKPRGLVPCGRCSKCAESRGARP